MKGFSYYMLWLLAVAVSVLIYANVYLNIELKKTNKQIDVLSGVVSVLVFEEMEKRNTDTIIISEEKYFEKTP